MEKLRIDYLESEDGGYLESEDGVEKLAARLRLAGFAGGRGECVGPVGEYQDVGDYDPVLRFHCRLEE